MKLLSTLSVLAFASVVHAVRVQSDIFTLDWTLAGANLQLTMECTTAQYMVLSLGARGNHNGDGIVCDAGGCDDRTISGTDIGGLDQQQNLQAVTGGAAGAGLKFSMTRALNTGDPNDYVIAPGPVQLKWACGNGGRANAGQHNNAGGLAAQEFAGPAPPTPPSPVVTPVTPVTPIGGGVTPIAPTPPVYVPPVGDGTGAPIVHTNCAGVNCQTAGRFPNPTPLLCKASGCTLTECCISTPSCATFTCGANYIRKTTLCPNGQCSSQSCCIFDQTNVSITDNLCPQLQCAQCVGQSRCTYCLQNGGAGMACTEDLSKCATDIATNLPLSIVSNAGECQFAQAPKGSAASTVSMSLFALAVPVLAMLRL